MDTGFPFSPFSPFFPFSSWIFIRVIAMAELPIHGKETLVHGCSKVGEEPFVNLLDEKEKKTVRMVCVLFVMKSLYNLFSYSLLKN